MALNLDFSENYVCVSQMEIQSAHWGHNQISIHPVAAYYKSPQHEMHRNCPGNAIIHFRRFDLTAMQSTHSLQKVNEHLKGICQLDIEKEIQFSDGCSFQYK